MRELVVVRGGGHIASGIVYQLVKSGFDVVILETMFPSAVRRNAAFSETVYNGKSQVGDVVCYLEEDLSQIGELLEKYHVALYVDEQGQCMEQLNPVAVVDTILGEIRTRRGTKKRGYQSSKKKKWRYQNSENESGRSRRKTRKIETKETDAKEIEAEEVKINKIEAEEVEINKIEAKEVEINKIGTKETEAKEIETNKIETKETDAIETEPNKIEYIYASAQGFIKNRVSITDLVAKGDTIAHIICGNKMIPIKAGMNGELSGLIRDHYPVSKGLKIAEITSQVGDSNRCFPISDRAKGIAYEVLETLHSLLENEN